MLASVLSRSLLNVRVTVLVSGVCAAVGSRAETRQNFIRHLSTSASMSDKCKKFNSDELKQRLSDVEYSVTQLKDTERPFTGKYLHNKDTGTYTCVVCDSHLFSSNHKFESGCGWPAFSEVLSNAAVDLTPDDSLGMRRTEVTCSACGAHLGHVFDDGPPPSRTRYCINSAAMSFTPAS